MPEKEKAKEKKTQSGFFYWQYGNEQKKPILLLPGFTGVHKDLSNIANLLKEKYCVIIPEFPGWEDAISERSTYTITSYAHMVHHMLKDLHLSRVTIVAHCMGATVALEAAREDASRIRQLILISTPYQGGTLGQEFFSFLARLSEKVPPKFRPLFFFWRSRLITTPMSFFVLQTRTLRRKLSLIGKVLTTQSQQNEHVLETNWDSLIFYNYAQLHTLRIPVHLLHGENDLLISPAQAAKLAHLLPNATYMLIPHAGHLPPVETPHTAVRLIESFLS